MADHAVKVTNKLKDFSETVQSYQPFPLVADRVEILQLNLGLGCNLCCSHCHLQAGPNRSELMSAKILENCRQVIEQTESISTVDLTGGSPELNPNLEWLIKELAKLNKRLIVRSNLIILLEERYRSFIELFANYGVELVGSLPCYLAENVNQQRGEKVFQRSIEAIKLLNQKGYGNGKSGLKLDFVYNPVGAYLPGPQEELEKEYQQRLRSNYNILFDKLFCLTNMPIGRFLEDLEENGEYDNYMQELREAFNPKTLTEVMCRSTVSVSWDGALFDCDFNQALDLPLEGIDQINKFDLNQLVGRKIKVGNHCYGCTAGSGSSCQGALE